MKNYLLVAAVLFGAYLVYLGFHSPAAHKSSSSSPDQSAIEKSDGVLSAAFRSHLNNIRVQGQGAVVRVLSDDNSGTRHQRFIIRLASGQTLLIAHNIDIAPRVQGLKAGDEIKFSGEYEYNEQGGVIHYTHHDPGGRHAGGWLECKGRRYE